MKHSAVDAMTPVQTKKLVDAYQKKGPGGKGPKPPDPATVNAKGFYAKYGVKPAATAAIGNASNAVDSASGLIRELKTGGNGRSAIAKLLTEGGKVPLAGQKDANGKQMYKTYPKLKGLWVSVALDKAFLSGRISAGTAAKLHRAGYSARLLGLNTGGSNIPSGKI